MKKLSIFLILLCGIGFVHAQTTQDDEANRLSAESVKLFNEKKYKEAQPLAEKAVRLREQEFGANDFKTAEALRNLGFIQVGNEDKKEAEKTLEKAIGIYERKTDLSPDSQSQLAQMLETVAFIKFENRKIERAIELYQKASELREKAHGKDALENVNSLLSLATIYHFQKDYKNAEKMYRRVLEIRAKKLARSDWNRQDAENRFQCVAVRNDHADEAKNFIKSLEAGNLSNAPDQAKLGPQLVRGGVVNGKATYLAKPPYPSEARSSRASGAVNVQITIDEQGKVIFACAMSGNKLLFDASESAAYQSTFSPTMLSGKPVKVMGVVIYNFVP